MAINMDFGGDNEYVTAAQKAAAGASGGPSLIASVLDLLGIHRQAAKGPKTPDLAEEKKADDAKPPKQLVTDEKGEAVGVTQPDAPNTLLDQAAAASGINPLPMTSSAAVSQGMSLLSGQAPPNKLKTIDPDLAHRGIIKPLR